MNASRKYVEIDMMRGIAILMVILVHTSQTIDLGSGRFALVTAYGQMGVQLFFVASAFTLSHSWNFRALESNQLLKYMIRRFFRIAPMYYFGIVFFATMSAAISYFNSRSFSIAAQYTAPNVLANVIFVNGFFPQANNNIVPGGWSIGTEVAFYCIFPMLFSASRHLHARRAIVCAMIGVLFTSIAAVRAVCYVYGQEFYNNGFVYFNLATQLPVFAVGIAMFKLDGDAWPVQGALKNGIIFFAITFLSLFVFRTTQAEPFFWVPVLSSISFMFLFHTLKANRIQAGRAPLARVGQLSFSMYLFHTLFAHKVSGEIAPYIQQRLPGWATLLCCYAIAVLATVAVAIFSERLIEAPSIALGKQLVRRVGSPA